MASTRETTSAIKLLLNNEAGSTYANEAEAAGGEYKHYLLAI